MFDGGAGEPTASSSAWIKTLAYKVSSGFGGGMHFDQTCGAVTGAFMVIGLKFGRTRADDIEAKMKDLPN